MTAKNVAVLLNRMNGLMMVVIIVMIVALYLFFLVKKSFAVRVKGMAIR